MRKKTAEEFVAEAQKVHGNKYDYTLVMYDGMHTKVEVVCPEHGKFSMTPTHHIHRGQGCVQCNSGIEAKVYDQDIYLRKVMSVHSGRYLYDKTVFLSSKDKLTVTCPLHGDFIIRAGHHASGVGCYQCGRGTRKHSKMAVEWLSNIAKKEGIVIQHAENGGEYRIPGTRYDVDGYCEDTNTVYEFYGNVWHGNPKLFSPDQICHPRKAIKAGDLFQRTMRREEYIKSLGYGLITIWESDWGISDETV